MEKNIYILYFLIIIVLIFICVEIGLNINTNTRNDIFSRNQWSQKKNQLENLELSKITFYTGGGSAKSVEFTGVEKDNFMNCLLTSEFYRSIRTGQIDGGVAIVLQTKTNIYNKDYKTEWEFLKDVLVINGVDKNAILREDKATNTYENAIFSKKVTDSKKLNIQKAVICCKSFHARRCLMYYQLLYQQTQFIICPAEIRGINKENWFKTDDGINTVMGELARCGSQFAEIIKQLK